MQGWESFLPLIGIILLFWFIAIRPARRRQQQLSATQNSVAVGSEVMLGSGIYGTVVGVEELTLDLQVAPGTTMKVARQAVVRVVEPETPVAETGWPQSSAVEGDVQSVQDAQDADDDENGSTGHIR